MYQSKKNQIKFPAIFILLLFAFNSMNAQSYVSDDSDQYNEKILITIPEVYELINIAIAITSFGESHPYYINKDTPYHAEVMKHFAAFKTHSFIKSIQEYHGNVDGFNFLKMRAAASHFFEENIVCDKKQLYLPTEEDEVQLHEELISAAVFAKETGFQSFYEDHLPYYKEQLKMFKTGIPTGDCLDWLEKQFPSRNHQLNIFLSPLTGWSHFAVGKQDYTDIYIFGPNEYIPSKTEEGMHTMVLFTELDHKYVDVISRDYADEIDSAFANVRDWNGQKYGYQTPQLTFSEYMTWAVFCLYASDKYEEEVFSEIKQGTVEFMTVNRKFPRFGEFNDQLLELYKNREEGVTVPDLYTKILEWAQNSRN